jgi:hypothetical protein
MAKSDKDIYLPWTVEQLKALTEEDGMEHTRSGKEFYGDQDAFDRICGDCCGVDMFSVTPDDVRETAKMHALNGESCSDEMIAAAIRGLNKYQKHLEDN